MATITIITHTFGTLHHISLLIVILHPFLYAFALLVTVI